MRGVSSSSRPTSGTALARPPSFSHIPSGSGDVPRSPSSSLAPPPGFGFPGQPLAAPPASNIQQAQNHQRLLQMQQQQQQRQQQLRQLHSQRRDGGSSSSAVAASQQSQSLSQLQQNYMQHLAATEQQHTNNTNRGNVQHRGNSSVSSNNNNNTMGQHQMPQHHNASPMQQSAPRSNGLAPPPQSLMMNRSTSGNASSSVPADHRNFVPPNQGNQMTPPAKPPPPPAQRSSSTASASSYAAAATSAATTTPGTHSAASAADTATTHPSMPPPSGSSATKANGQTSSLAASTSKAASLPPLEAVPEKDVPGLLQKCDWKDKTLWVSRQLLGGQALNGFLRSTATVQRLKRQRVRQVRPKETAASKTDDAASVNSNPSAAAGSSSAAAGKKRDTPSDHTADEREIKIQVMNARTAKKIRSEMEVGLKFCELMHETIRGILTELDAPGVAIPAPLGPELPVVPSDKVPSPQNPLKAAAAAVTKPLPLTKQTSRATSTASRPPTTGLAAPPPLPAPSAAQPVLSPMASAQSSTAAGSAKNSTLRRNRRKKLAPSNELSKVGLSEFDAMGKRILSKKDFTQRVFEIVRFRSLREGDHVAARLSSRDLWILARITKDYAGVNVPAVEFLQLSVTRRDSLFREKVYLRDVEDKDSGPTAVARNLVLPLPRNYSEASEWGQHYRKGARVYAMYPETTSLYTATVVDNTTYCQGEDDIIVVEFDGDEPDHTGSPPKCHIPARFVTLIPREFPSFQDKPTRRQSSASAAAPTAAAAAGGGFSGFADPLNSLDLTLDAMESFDGFDDLDFDLGLGN